MVNRSKQKGTAHESAIRDYLDSRGVVAFRTASTGRLDEGDLVVPEWDAIIEAKNTKQIRMAEAVDEARIEAVNAKRRYGIAIIKRHRANIAKAYVVMSFDDFVDLMEATDV